MPSGGCQPSFCRLFTRSGVQIPGINAPPFNNRLRRSVGRRFCINRKLVDSRRGGSRGPGPGGVGARARVCMCERGFYKYQVLMMLVRQSKEGREDEAGRRDGAVLQRRKGADSESRPHQSSLHNLAAHPRNHGRKNLLRTEDRWLPAAKFRTFPNQELEELLRVGGR